MPLEQYLAILPDDRIVELGPASRRQNVTLAESQLQLFIVEVLRPACEKSNQNICDYRPVPVGKTKVSRAIHSVVPGCVHDAFHSIIARCAMNI